jgi:hypothetical protein
MTRPTRTPESDAKRPGRRERRSRIRRWSRAAALLLAGAAIGATGLGLIVAGDIYEFQDSVDGIHLPPVDAVVCLAGGRGRILAAGDIWYRYWETSQKPVSGVERTPVPPRPPILYISGMGHQAGWNVLTRQVHRGVLGSLKPENVVLETESANTEENALLLLQHARKRGWERILLMTSSYHMRRAKLIFQRMAEAQGVRLEIETLAVQQEPFDPMEWRAHSHGIRVTVIEYLKYLYYKRFWTPPPTAKPA